MAQNSEFRRFVAAYLECALWSSTAHGAPDMERYGYTADNIAPAARLKAIRDCRDFWRSNKDLLDSLCDEHRADATTLGHDFWLTRNRHGAGFWDRGYGAKGDELTKDAHAYGELSLYVGNDGLIYGF